MWSEFWSSTRTRALAKVTGFGRDAGNIFQALGWWGIVFLLVELVLGLLPIFGVVTLGGTVDAMIGARGIGVVTSDVNHELSRWLVMLIVGFLAYLFSARFTGKAGEVGRGLRDIVIFGSLLGYLVTIQQFFLVFVFLLILTIDITFAHDVRVRMASLLVAILAGSAIAHTLIRYTVLRSFTVGEGLTMVAAIALFVVFLKLRIAYAPHN
jgi:hypothetical protein